MRHGTSYIPGELEGRLIYGSVLSGGNSFVIEEQWTAFLRPLFVLGFYLVRHGNMETVYSNIKGILS